MGDALIVEGDAARGQHGLRDLALARRWFLNASIERDHSDVDRLLQEYLALSWRF